MSTEAAFSSPVVVNRADGSELHFKRLAPSDLIELQRAFVTFRKALLLENLTMTKAGLEVRLRTLNEFDAKRVRTSDVDEWINTPAGQVTALRLSLARDKAGATVADVDALALSRCEMLEAAAKVCGLGITTTGGEGREKDRPLGGAADAIDTGSPTPPASATG